MCGNVVKFDALPVLLCLSLQRGVPFLPCDFSAVAVQSRLQSYKFHSVTHEVFTFVVPPPTFYAASNRFSPKSLKPFLNSI